MGDGPNSTGEYSNDEDFVFSYFDLLTRLVVRGLSLLLSGVCVR